MKFSKKSEYGLRALIELTKNYGHPITRQQIGERQNVPVVFLEQILLSLKHAGLLASTRGVQGGYALIKPPSKVTLGQVIRILDGPLAPIACVSKTAYQNLDNYTLENFISGMNGSRRSPVRRATARRLSET